MGSYGVTGGVLVMESFLNDFCVGWRGQMMADCSRATERLPQPLGRLHALVQHDVRHRLYGGCYNGWLDRS
ncbi:hypothetical protein PsorP6_012680 [Peronosclerospora sorghi]|uniref:Uncharacterized protein n=1 Tax=Peronosclerospora sorghi TaxID=230839 RepID=A0ACC0WFP7_9STRA|nr:hypothetical protein PsorP6_012680 [Peronosclerospora sorghi]